LDTIPKCHGIGWSQTGHFHVSDNIRPPGKIDPWKELQNIQQVGRHCNISDAEFALDKKVSICQDFVEDVNATIGFLQAGVITVIVGMRAKA